MRWDLGLLCVGLGDFRLFGSETSVWARKLKDIDAGRVES